MAILCIQLHQNTPNQLTLEKTGDTLPDGFLPGGPIGEITDAVAYSGSKSLYIKDDRTDCYSNVTCSFTPAKGTIVEFMAFPELIEHSLSIGIGDGANSISNEAFWMGFTMPPEGSSIMRVRAYDGKSWTYINNISYVFMNQWNKIRIEVTVDKMARLYVNGIYIADVPVCSNLSQLSRMRFSTGGTTLVDDYYYIDDVQIIYFGD